MRKVKLQMQVTVDGFVCGPNGEMDWMTWNWDDDLKAYVNALTEPVDTIVLGRVTASGFIPHWEKVAASPEDPSYAFGKIMNDTLRVVFSKTAENGKWDNAVIEPDTDAVKALKNKPGGDIIVYGGASLAASLIEKGLIDEYYLFMNPAAIGTGKAIFKELTQKSNLKLVESKAFDCGIVVLVYQPVVA